MQELLSHGGPRAHTHNGRVMDWIGALLGDSSVNAWIAQQSVGVT
jgi:hypothetical protein